jgi:hypothetical protein
MKMERESKEYMERERSRLELIAKDKEENAKEAVDQHFEESLRLARQKVCLIDNSLMTTVCIYCEYI